MKTYRSHKRVQAAKILAAERIEEGGNWYFVTEGNELHSTSIDEAPRFRITEEDLGYLVVYEDGYRSWSPTKAFEEGYYEEPKRPAGTDAAYDEELYLRSQEEGPGPILKTGIDLGSELSRVSKMIFASFHPDAMSFAGAIIALQGGHRVARKGWNGKGMWLALSCNGSKQVSARNFWSHHNANHAEMCGGKATVLPSITMKTADGSILMGWLASQTDMLADDWHIVEEGE